MDYEQDRLKTLDTLGVLDTPPEQVFDEIVNIAAALCDVPICLVSLVDRDRQWFKAKKGLTICETARDVAFCSYAILSDEPLLVEDALNDPRFAENPLVVGEPFIRFYLGMPLRVQDNYRVGTLCVIDSQPRNLTELQMQTLAVLSRHVSDQLDKRLANKERRQMATTFKMSALGEMVAGVAHDISSPLTVIIFRARELLELEQRKKLEPQKISTTARSIEVMGLRIEKTVRALLSFARDGEGGPFEVCLLTTVLDEALELCQVRVKHGNIRIRKPAETEVQIRCRPVQISQLLFNLISNACDAIEELDERWVEIEFIKDKEFVSIIVMDSGLTPPMSVQDRMMEPFFTTKPLGKGTGLGLSISQQIVRGHQGTLNIDAKSAHTRFVVQLPLPH